MNREMRSCAFCSKTSVVYDEDGYHLFKYSLRRYAHATCLAAAKGTQAARASVPAHELPDFRVEMKIADPWWRSLIDAKDRQKLAMAGYPRGRGRPRPNGYISSRREAKS